MLRSPKNEWGWSVSNFSSTAFTLAAFGSAVTPGTNTKGSWTNVLSNTAYDSYGINIAIGAAGTAGAAYGGLLDVGYDSANGTAYQTLIPNLAYTGSSIVYGGTWYYFPMFIPKGSSIGLRAQASTGTTAIRAGVQLFGQPSRPDLVRTASYVEAFNVNTANSFGTTASGTMGVAGSYGAFSSSLGTTAKDLWFWQSGMTINAAAFVKYVTINHEVYGGVNSRDTLLVSNASFNCTDTELATNLNPQQDNYAHLPAGSGIYVHMMTTNTAPLAGVFPIVYGAGG